LIKRIFDYRKIKRLTPWQPVISSKVIYLIDEGQGLWMFHEHLDGLMIHVEMHINCRGKEAIRRGRNAVKWVFDNMKANTLYARIPKINKLACHNARHGGMVFTHEEDGIRYFKITKDRFMRYIYGNS